MFVCCLQRPGDVQNPDIQNKAENAHPQTIWRNATCDPSGVDSNPAEIPKSPEDKEHAAIVGWHGHKQTLELLKPYPSQKDVRELEAGGKPST